MSKIEIANLQSAELFEELSEYELESVVGGLSAGFYAVNGVVNGQLINPTPIDPGTQVSSGFVVNVGDDGKIIDFNVGL